MIFFKQHLVRLRKVQTMFWRKCRFGFHVSETVFVYHTVCKKYKVRLLGYLRPHTKNTDNSMCLIFGIKLICYH